MKKSVRFITLLLTVTMCLSLMACSNPLDGKDGKSAYELALENGFEGTLDEWLVSLKVSGITSSNSGNIYKCNAAIDVSAQAKITGVGRYGIVSNEFLCGGIVNENSGTIVESYATGKIKDINNSFTTGAIDNTNSNASTGYFVGSPNASGIMLKCYYDRDMVYMLNGETATPANSLSEAEQLFILKSNDFLKETLLWKEKFWVIDGLELPTLVYNLI